MVTFSITHNFLNPAWNISQMHFLDSCLNARTLWIQCNWWISFFLMAKQMLVSISSTWCGHYVLWNSCLFVSEIQYLIEWKLNLESLRLLNLLKHLQSIFWLVHRQYLLMLYLDFGSDFEIRFMEKIWKQLQRWDIKHA